MNFCFEWIYWSLNFMTCFPNNTGTDSQPEMLFVALFLSVSMLLTVVYQERGQCGWDDNYRSRLDIDTWDQLHPINIPVTSSSGSSPGQWPIKTGGCWPSVFSTTSLCRSEQQVNTVSGIYLLKLLNTLDIRDHSYFGKLWLQSPKSKPSP